MHGGAACMERRISQEAPDGDWATQFHITVATPQYLLAFINNGAALCVRIALCRYNRLDPLRTEAGRRVIVDWADRSPHPQARGSPSAPGSRLLPPLPSPPVPAGPCALLLSRARIGQ